jgi:hypothetical protein
MVFSGHLFAASIALIAVLSDILTVALSVVPYSPGQIYLELLVSSYMSMAILALMVVAIISLLLWRWRWQGMLDLPRRPETLAAVISYVCASRMLDDFEGLECLDGGQRDQQIVGMRKRYGYGRRRCVDGVVRWAIDEN